MLYRNLLSMEDKVCLQFIILFFIVLAMLYATEGGSSMFNLPGKRFFALSRWSIELKFI